MNAAGTLLVYVPGGDPLRFHKPVVYQHDGSAKREVAGAFAVEGRTVRLALGEYDRAMPLANRPSADILGENAYVAKFSPRARCRS